MIDLSTLSERDQLKLLCDLIQGGPGVHRSDAFIDAMMPVDEAFSAAYDALDAAAEYEPDNWSFDFALVHPDDPCQSKGRAW